ncbi:EG45-like domain containing protein [Quillaja saponaria]|uniref:EG45-like domain containing protein n=1 Tax=Quillaja saponaria TaxID=32244 RepID=A0AAD7LA35_QUISA|nr:EG45-like domain containing protein [Quillaja saponaria]
MAKSIFLSSILILMVFSICTWIAIADTGTATFYTPPYVPSSCHGYKNDGVLIAAASDTIWDNRGACGRKCRVKCLSATSQGVPHPCKGGSVVVTIVDYCPPHSCHGTIDLSQEAFASIANPDAGKINIAFQQ